MKSVTRIIRHVRHGAHAVYVRGQWRMVRMPAPIQPRGQNDDVHGAAIALGNTVRLAIIHELAQGPLLGPELIDRLGLPSGTVGPHLTILRNHGVITSNTQSGRGRPTLHALHQSRLDELVATLVQYLEPEGRTHRRPSWPR